MAERKQKNLWLVMRLVDAENLELVPNAFNPYFGFPSKGIVAHFPNNCEGCLFVFKTKKAAYEFFGTKKLTFSKLSKEV